jgi:hypothetical protein
VSGTPGFVRQLLDELPALMARLRGEAPPTPGSIRMPPPSGQGAAAAPEEPALSSPEGPAASSDAQPAGAEPRDGTVPTTPGQHNGSTAAAGGEGGSLEDRVLAALSVAPRPLPVAAIRERVGTEVSGQQVRRILERAGSRVVATGDRPIRYRLR